MGSPPHRSRALSACLDRFHELRILAGLREKVEKMDAEHAEIAELFTRGIVKGYPKESLVCIHCSLDSTED